jgi:hypothetical protein
MGCYLVKLLDSDHSHLFSFVNLRDIKANMAIKNIKTCRHKREERNYIFFKGGNVVIMIRKTKIFPFLIHT